MKARHGWGAAVVAAVVLGPRIAAACAPAPRARERVAVAEESAIIVWDEAAKREHFIRRASFRSEARDFGFLVPTPSRPELAEADETAFEELESAVRPELEYREHTAVEPTLLLLFPFMFYSRSAAAPEMAPVRVLEAKRVGDYDATVLEADDAGALGDWLTQRGYAKGQALTEWLVPYVEKKWKLTAFKIADDVDAGASTRELGTRAVRMSFTTDRPFFPYREPRDQRESLPPHLSSTRSLRVFFFGAGRAAATIGAGATVFPGKTTWSGPLHAGHVPHLSVALPAGAWLTAFEDDASPRPGVDELWLDRAKEQSPVKPPPTVVSRARPIPLPLDLLALVGVIVFFVVRRVRRARRQRA
ncbi:MAG: DUF2330 domain-containing protein [Labilithrix sp.]|nr:DUF2330 domain-containing protein [Labilithrix sp.]MCW5815740.1 DUF2330 domain-containing protein [Labilithrix sp.]